MTRRWLPNRLDLAERCFLTAILTVLGAPVMAQEPALSRWTLSVTAGPGFGGPVGQLKQRLLAEQWTDRHCDYRQTTCRNSPSSKRGFIQFSGALSRRLSDKLELKAVVEVGDLGQVRGSKGEFEIYANWKTATVGTAVILHPMPRVRIGGGPLLAMLTRQVLPTENANPIRAGFLFEGGLRSSERAATFLELVVAYRLLPSLPEGPWPGNGNSSQVYTGPAGIDANFSHFTIGVGAGIRF